MKEKLEKFLNEILPECSEDWEEFMIFLQEAADHTFRKKVSNDWFDYQDEEVQEPIKDKKLNRNALRDRIRTDGSRKKRKKRNSLLKKRITRNSIQL